MPPALDQGGGADARAVPWQDITSAFFEAIQVEAMMFLILSLIILVAALNIVSA